MFRRCISRRARILTHVRIWRSPSVRPASTASKPNEERIKELTVKFHELKERERTEALEIMDECERTGRLLPGMVTMFGGASVFMGLTNSWGPDWPAVICGGIGVLAGPVMFESCRRSFWAAEKRARYYFKGAAEAEARRVALQKALDEYIREHLDTK
jgi:hypothetical protein